MIGSAQVIVTFAVMQKRRTMMSRYIDKEDLLNALFAEQPKDWVGYIAKYPTADVVEVVHGEWNRLSCDTFHCNLCGRTFILMQGNDAMNYCPNCGAIMRGGNNAE